MNLTPKSTILAALKSGLVISSLDGWLLKVEYGELMAEVEGREVRLYPVSASGLEQALEWVTLPF